MKIIAVWKNPFTVLKRGVVVCAEVLLGSFIVQFPQILFAAPAVVAEPWHVTERTAHSRVWESVDLVADPVSGRMTPQKHRFVELATGMHYDAGGTWAESEEKFEITPQGHAVAAKGQHKVTLAANINAGASVDLLTPDGQRFLSNPMGLSFFDSATGKNVLIAEVKDCVGEQVAPNVILYRDAFDTVKGAIRYTYTKAGFSQDIILHQNPGSPADWGLDPATTLLVMYTELHGPQLPQQAVTLTATNQGKGTAGFWSDASWARDRLLRAAGTGVRESLRGVSAIGRPRFPG